MPNLYEFRSASWEACEEEKISGYAAVFEQRTVLFKDPVTGKEYGEVIDRHALDAANMSDVVLRYNHAGRVLARTRNNSLQLSLDEHGLKIEASLNGSDEARSLYQDVKSGLIDKMSFAFVVDSESWESNTSTRRILKISEIRDVALVDFPAYEQTEVKVRSKFEALAEPDRRAFRVSQVKGICSELRSRIDDLKISGNAEDYCTRSEYLESLEYRKHAPFGLVAGPDKADPVRRELLELRTQLDGMEESDDIAGMTELRNRIELLERELASIYQEKRQLRSAIAAGAGTIIETNLKGEKKMPEQETRAFIEKLVEARAAGNTQSMSHLIPETVMDQYAIESAPGVFYNAASVSKIAHSGNLTLPIAKLQEVSEHVENAEIPTDGYVPEYITISHKEYAYNTGYSKIGIAVGASAIEKIVQNTCVNSMLKKVDALCIAAAADLDYTDNENAVAIAKGSVPVFADFVKLAGMLGADYLDKAKWRMSQSTYFNWMLGLKDDNGKPILDPSKKAEDQAPAGFGIELDSQLPANVVYFGDGSRVHVNFADGPVLNAWMDYEHNTQKIGVTSVLGVAAEPGCMVKMYQSMSESSKEEMTD